MKLSELAEFIGGRIDGDESLEITGLTTLAMATRKDVSFLANIRYQSQLAETQAAAVIVDEDQPAVEGLTLIRCKDPYFSFRQAMLKIYGFRKHPFSGVSPQASVAASASLGKNVTVSPFAVVCDNATIGENTVLYPGAFIGPNCKIGSDCVIYPNAVVYDDCVLGDRVTLHAGCVVGVDGFGYSTHKCEDGVVRHDKIPPVGNVVIDDDVELGACCAIQRATIGSSVIGAGTKFADLIGIGHGTKLGQHCLLVSQAGIAGSTTVGNYCVFGGQVGVVGHITIGDGVQVAAKAGVTNDVPAGQELLGQPAIPRAEARRVIMASMKLPEMRTQMKQLIKQVEKLNHKIEQLEKGTE